MIILQRSDFGIAGDRSWGYDLGLWLREHGPELAQAAQDPANLTLGAGALAGTALAGGLGVKLGAKGIRAAWGALHAPPGEIALGARREKFVHHLTDPRVKLGWEARRKGGVQLVGPTGQGKTTLLLRMVIEDLLQGHTVILVEADGDLGLRLLEYVEPLGLGSRLFYFDPTVPSSHKWNPLSGDTERVVNQAVDTVASVSSNHEFYADLNEDVMRHMTALACACAEYVGREATVGLLLRLLTDRQELEELLDVSTDAAGKATVGAPFVSGELRTWLEQEFSCWSQRVRREYLLGLRNVLRKLLSSQRVVDALTPEEDEPAIDVGRALNTGGIVVFRAPSDELGEAASQTLLTWALQRIQQETLARKWPMRPVCVYLDEAHAVLGRHNTPAAESYSRWFVQSRRFNVAPHLGYQSFFQLPDVLRRVLDGSARNKLIFGGLYGDDALHAQKLLGHTVRHKEEVREVSSGRFMEPPRRQKVSRPAEEPYFSLPEIETLPQGRCFFRGVRAGRQLPPTVVLVKEPPPAARIRARVPGAAKQDGGRGRRAR